jgi:glycosyltransferase involved in cell wall biosynthesis
MGVSIIIPAYNSEKYLPATIQSVLAQTIKDWELVVVNDGSIDQTGNIAETFAALDNRIRIVHQENAGIAKARNRGFTVTRKDYEYCMFFDHDDLLAPDAFNVLINTLKINQDASAAHGMLRYIDSNGNPMDLAGYYAYPIRRSVIQGMLPKDLPLTSPTTFKALAYNDCIPAGGVMIPRGKKEVVGDFDSRAEPADDWDMWLRLSRLGDIAFINKVVYSWRLHERNTSKNSQLMSKSELYVREKIYKLSGLSSNDKRIILIGYTYHELYRARRELLHSVRKLYRGRPIEAFNRLQIAMRHILSSFRGLG